MTDTGINNSKKNIDSKILSIVHLLHPYVKQRIRVGENLGIFPKRMYQANGIIDEVILSVYENKKLERFDPDNLKIKMFDLVNKRLKNLFEEEKWHKKTISTKLLLEGELKGLEEILTVDGDNDLIMTEDLEDISYCQVDYTEVLPYEDEQDIVFTFLDITHEHPINNLKNSGYEMTKSYYKLPVQTTNIVDLYILGKLSLQEISHILEIEIVEVKRIIDYVKKKFIKQMI